MAFVEQNRTGEVMGNRVTAKPVPFKLMAALNEAQRKGDETGVVETMCAIVSGYVTTEDGDPIDAQEISQKAVTELFRFAVQLEGGVADFTSAR